MKRIILSESQYNRLVSQKLNEEVTLTGEKVTDFDIDLENNIISKWSKNNPKHVERLQRMLKLLGYELGNYGPNKDGVDGIYGAFTEDSVEEFQMEEMPNQPEQWDGVIGPVTYNLLKSKSNEVAEEKGEELDTMLSDISKPKKKIASLFAKYYDPDKVRDNVDSDIDMEDIDVEDIDDYLVEKDPLVKGKNGNLSIDELTYIGKDGDGNVEYLSKDAAKWFNKMKSDAEKEGITIEISDAYRPCGRPGDYKRYKKGKIRFTQWAAWEQYKYDANMAAKPEPSTAKEWKKNGGYCTSNHGLGKAVDVNGSNARKWVKSNGEKYGFYKYDKEKWHFDFKTPETTLVDDKVLS